MSKDYIASSIKISEWLESLDIHIEVDRYAPYVKAIGEGGTTQGVFPAYLLGYYNNRGTWIELENICPYFGPGGADNLLKALRAWVEYMNEQAEGDRVYDLTSSDNLCGETSYGIWVIDTTTDETGYGPRSKYAPSDGIALHDLLCKLMEETK